MKAPITRGPDGLEQAPDRNIEIASREQQDDTMLAEIARGIAWTNVVPDYAWKA
jgi:hypothetical protein